MTLVFTKWCKCRLFGVAGGGQLCSGTMSSDRRDRIYWPAEAHPPAIQAPCNGVCAKGTAVFSEAAPGLTTFRRNRGTDVGLVRHPACLIRSADGRM